MSRRGISSRRDRMRLAPFSRESHRAQGARADPERGAALLLALLTCALLAAMAATVLVSTSADLLITGSQRASLETMYVAEAGMERAFGEIAALPDWSVLLASPSSSQLASFDDGMVSARTPDGR